MTTTNSTPSTKRMVWVALFTAITCILAPLSIPIPISPVPITLTNLVLFISLYLLSWKEALTSYILYLLLGFAGFRYSPASPAESANSRDLPEDIWQDLFS